MDVPPSASGAPPALRRPERLTPWQSIALRTAAVLALIGIALAGHWFDREGLKDNTDGHISFVDVIYFTMITVTTVGYGDIVPVTERARLFDTFVVTPVRIFVWLIFLGTAYSFVIRRSWERIRTRMIGQGLNDHVIVCGYGGAGCATVAELLRQCRDPHSIVVIDQKEERVAAALDCGVLAMQGDATRNATLESARVDRARAVIVSPGRDDTAALIVLTARRLSPHTRISASVLSDENEDLVQQAGASTVVNPASFSGHLLAHSVSGPQAVDYLHDLATAGGSVVIRERAVALNEIGTALAEVRTGLGLRVLRGAEAFGFWEPQAKRLEAGDVLVEIVPNGGSTG